MINWFVLCIAACTCCYAQAGVVVEGTRFIFNADKTSITFTVNNTSQQRFLLLSKVLDAQGQATRDVPFMTTPPLFPLAAGHSNIIRIIRTGGDLPDDRESLFWLSVASIPQTQGKPSPNSLQVAIRSRMKLFFRPLGLKGREEDAYRQLTWQRAGMQVQVNNPTPYYVTLFHLQLNGIAVNNVGMVAPFSRVTTSGCPVDGPCRVQWQTINDYGRVMPARQQALN